MTDDKRKKIESCFESMERMTSLHDTLGLVRDQVSNYLQETIERLEVNQQVLEAGDWELKDGLIKLNDTDIKYINSKHADSLWYTMRMLLPHYKTQK